MSDEGLLHRAHTLAARSQRRFRKKNKRTRAYVDIVRRDVYVQVRAGKRRWRYRLGALSKPLES